MIKSKLLKVLALGLCMSALYTGAAYAAQSGGGSAPAAVGQQTDPEAKALFEKQSEIDQYVFTDHVSDLKEKGISVVYTGVADNYVEIGITPYNDANAKYFYDIFGNDNLKVVAGEEAALYNTSEIAPNETVSSDAVMGTAAETTVASTSVAAGEGKASAGTATVTADATEVGTANADDQQVKIQIESVEGAQAPDQSEATYQTVSAPAGQESADAQVVSTAVDSSAANNADSDSNALSAPVIILIIAGGAVLIGGAVLVTGKKKADK